MISELALRHLRHSGVNTGTKGSLSVSVAWAPSQVDWVVSGRAAKAMFNEGMSIA
jgi:hypothetical protein